MDDIIVVNKASLCVTYRSPAVVKYVIYAFKFGFILCWQILWALVPNPAYKAVP